MVRLRHDRRGLRSDLGRDRIDSRRHGERRRKEASCRGGRNEPQRIGYFDVTADGSCRGRVAAAAAGHDDDHPDDHPDDHDYPDDHNNDDNDDNDYDDARPAATAAR